jgi:hypothetical protein
MGTLLAEADAELSLMSKKNATRSIKTRPCSSDGKFDTGHLLSVLVSGKKNRDYTTGFEDL